MILFGIFLFGRSERIRTSDPLLPKQVRYQTALRSDRGAGLNRCARVCKGGDADLCVSFGAGKARNLVTGAAVVKQAQPETDARESPDVKP